MDATPWAGEHQLNSCRAAYTHGTDQIGNWRGVLVVLLLFGGVFPRPARAESESRPGIGGELCSDFRYLVNNTEADLEDVVTAPLHVGTLLTNPKFYFTLLGVGAVLGTAFALDEPVQRGANGINDNGARTLQSAGQAMAWAGTGGLYAWGLYSDDDRARQYAMTGVLSAGVSSLLTSAIKVAFGRLRPNQDHGAFRFFDHGVSFVSGATTPIFSLAASVAEYGDNEWYVAGPAYASAVAVGIGRMGQNAHWLSDITGSAIVGVGTTELLLYLHRQHAEDPSRFRIFPVVSPEATGLAVGYEW